MNDFDREDFRRMLFDYESNSLSPEATQELRNLLLNSQEAQREFAEWQSVNALIAFEDSALTPISLAPETTTTAVKSQVEVSLPQELPTQVQLRESRMKRVNLGGILAVAFGLLAALLGYRLLQVESETNGERLEASAQKTITSEEASPSTPPPQDELLSRGVALVTRLVDAELDTESSVATQPLRQGKAIVPGPLKLSAGIAQLEFYCGATLIVEGPAELDVLSSQSIRCVRGKIQAVVPPAARGFEVLVDDSKIIDLGTEFGLSVSETGTDLKVYDGEVELRHAAATESNLLTAGESASWLGNDLPVTENANSESESQPQLVDVERFRIRARGIANSRFERWKSFSESLRTDERLIAYYSMEEPSAWDRKTLDARIPRQPDLDGADCGCKPSIGQMGGKTSV